MDSSITITPIEGRTGAKAEVLAAVNEDGYSLQGDRDFMLEVIKQYGTGLYYASEALRADREVVLAAVNEDGYSLRWASDELRNDREVVAAAVMRTGLALKYASFSIRLEAARCWLVEVKK